MVAGVANGATTGVDADIGDTAVRDALSKLRRPRLPRKIPMPLTAGTPSGMATVLAARTPTGVPPSGVTVAGPAPLIRRLRRAVGGDLTVVSGMVALMAATGVVVATEAGANPGANTIKS